MVFNISLPKILLVYIKKNKMALGILEILLVLVIILILFGAKKLPELARSLGESVKEFKKGLKGK